MYKFATTFFNFLMHYEKKGYFVIDLVTQFLNCNHHLQFIIFLRYECYQTSRMSCKSYNSLYIRCNSLQFCQNNSFLTNMQFHYNYNHNVMLTLLIFIHPLKIDKWHNKKMPHNILIEFSNIHISHPKKAHVF
jgi:hypothetical protein